ncbi:MAG: HRDC domain-containing protein, partial [Ignavibacteriaceae bacterium]
YSTLKILESAGYLRTISELENKNSFRFITDKAKLKEFVKNSTNKKIKEIILLLLRLYGSSIFSNEVQLFLTDLGAKSGLQESDIDESMIILDNLGIGKYTKPLSKNSILLTSPRVNAERLKIDFKRLNESYLNLQKKIDKMVGYVFSNECRFKYILNYFGENVENYSCNKCDNCVEEKNISSESTEYLKEILLRTLHKTGPISDSVLISILKGSAKPDKYHKLETFGTCSNFQRNDLSNIELFNTLKEIRKSASKKFMQTGYLICPDEVLRDIVNKKPSNENELLSIKGFNQRMFNKFGNEFLEGIQKFKRKNGNETENIMKKGNKDIPQNIKETYILLKKGYPLNSIASLRNLSEAVISMLIETIIEYEPDINIKNLIGEEYINKINSEIEKGFIDLKDLKKRLPEEISYSSIRIAVAKYRFNSDSFSSRYQYTR